MNRDMKNKSNPPSAPSPAALTALGFDPDRLARVRAAVISDIEHGRYLGAAMRVARGGTTVLDLCEGYADRAAGTP